MKSQPFRKFTWEYLVLFWISSDKAISRPWTLSNNNSKENSHHLSNDKTWDNIYIISRCTKKLNEIASYKKLRWPSSSCSWKKFFSLQVTVFDLGNSSIHFLFRLFPFSRSSCSHPFFQRIWVNFATTVAVIHPLKGRFSIIREQLIAVRRN